MISELLLQAGSDPGFVDRLRENVESAIVNSTSILTDVVVALVILVVGVWIAGKLQSATVRVGRRVNLDDRVSQTPLSALFGDEEGAATAAFGVIVRYYVVLVAAFAALDYVGFTVVTRWLREAVTYVPIFLGGLLVLILGFVVADYGARRVANSETARSTGLSHVFRDVTRAVLYFVVVVIGLDTIGVSVGILYVVGEALALAVGLGAALALGIGFGWGAKDYVAANVEDWHREVRQD